MSLSAAGLKLLQYHELWTGGDVYTDPNGHRTIGYGHFLQPGEKFGTITRAQGLALLAKDAQKSVNYVNRLVTGATLTQTEFDTLVDFEFNIGDHHFANSSVLKGINAGNFILLKQILCNGQIMAQDMQLDGERMIYSYLTMAFMFIDKTTNSYTYN